MRSGKKIKLFQPVLVGRKSIITNALFFVDMRKKVTLPAVNHRTNISDHGRIGSKFIAVILTAIS